jgi:hypothetical protein
MMNKVGGNDANQVGIDFVFNDGMCQDSCTNGVVIILHNECTDGVGVSCLKFKIADVHILRGNRISLANEERKAEGPTDCSDDNSLSLMLVMGGTNSFQTSAQVNKYGLVSSRSPVPLAVQCISPLTLIIGASYS